MSKLSSQLTFIIEIDKLKSILRQSTLVDGSRRENSAEHSWHLAVMAVILQEHANEPVDLLRVVKLVLVHDLVEIDAGDTYAFDVAANVGKVEREQEAADRLFALLPPEQSNELMALWHEFENRQTVESKFANAVDRMMPFIHNITSNGAQWQKHGVTRRQVERRMAPVVEGSVTLANYVDQLVDQAVKDGLLRDG